MAVTLCTSQAVVDRCGRYANATIIASGGIIERYIGDAEQTIVAETRRNWIDGYSSVASGAKATLTLCTAAHAAKEIINYDMSGFLSTADGITALNVNENTFQRTLKSLKDLDNSSIRGVND